MLLPADWITGVRLERDPSRLAGAFRLATAAVVLPVAALFLVGGEFSPFLYYKF